MKIDEARLVIEPRSVGACIDLAVLFCRSHVGEVMGLTLCFGAPLTLAAYGLTLATDDGWLWSALSLFFVTPFLGAALVAGAGRWVFGEPFTVGAALRVTASRPWSLLYSLLLTRVGIGLTLLFCWGLPSIPLATRFGFLPEVILLEQLRGSRIGSRLGEIMKHTFWDATGRLAYIVFFGLASFLSIFIFIDMGSGTLLGFPILIGRVSSSFFFEEAVNLLFFDPLVVSTICGTLWLVYPLARLAWFFCYLDARIRKEGWDVELAFRVEAKRLQTFA
jgi:hypothetical protein